MNWNSNGSTSMWSPRGFLEAYNGYRFKDGQGVTGGRLRSPQQQQPSPGSVRQVNGYTYTLVRSDLDEDEARESRGKQEVKKPTVSYGIRRQLRNLSSKAAEPPKEGPQGIWPWVDSQWFQGVSGLIIFSNAIIIGMETDMDSWVWFYLEQALLIFFTFELTVRIARYGIVFFTHEDDMFWNLFDFSIVASGVFDQWIMELLEYFGIVHRGESSVGSVFMVMRMARLLRIVRLFRLVKIVGPLYELAQGVMEALQGMFWVLVFMIMTLYSTAILCTRLIGHGDALPQEALDDPEVQDIQAMFTTVFDSMFTLFGTMSSWSLMKFVPMFEETPLLRPVFVVFYIYSAWALLAVMTGVVSENMIAIREQWQREEQKKEEVRKNMITLFLHELFTDADADNSGSISRIEFDAMVRQPALQKKIAKNTHMKVQDLYDLFDWIDHDGGGTITIDEFMTGFKWLNEPLRAKSLIKFQERIAAAIQQVHTTVGQTFEQRIAEIRQFVAAPIRKVHAIVEQMQNMDAHFENVREGLRNVEQGTGAPTAQEVREMENRLSMKLSRVLERVKRLEAQLEA